MKALIIVDVQNDFADSRGRLPVKNGAEVISVINDLIENGNFDLIVATQDWHPANHKSFRVNNDVPNDEIVGELNGVPQVWWPEHCVTDSSGAEFHPDLLSEKIDKVFKKGTRRYVDSYSGFFDNKAIVNGKEERKPTGLGTYLKEFGITNVYIAGLATDYCVKFTAVDAKSCRFSTFLIPDGCRAVNINDGDGESAIEDMVNSGIVVINSKDVIERSVKNYE